MRRPKGGDASLRARAAGRAGRAPPHAHAAGALPGSGAGQRVHGGRPAGRRPLEPELAWEYAAEHAAAGAADAQTGQPEAGQAQAGQRARQWAAALRVAGRVLGVPAEPHSARALLGTRAPLRIHRGRAHARRRTARLVTRHQLGWRHRASQQAEGPHVSALDNAPRGRRLHADEPGHGRRRSAPLAQGRADRGEALLHVGPQCAHWASRARPCPLAVHAAAAVASGGPRGGGLCQLRRQLRGGAGHELG